MQRGVVLTGGSAGAICWFDGGHSDSDDPQTYKTAFLDLMNSGKEIEHQSWEYLRCRGLGFLPGLICPHFDKVQSNGVLRATDFETMMQRHPGERGIGIDHWAAFVVDGDDYSVWAPEGKEGSVLPDGSFSSERKGKPGIWVKDVVGGVVTSKRAPVSGKLSELLRPASEILEDPRVEECRKKNPDTSTITHAHH